MDLSQFEYELPEDLVAQQPAERRDGSRLMVVNRSTEEIQHTVFSELPSLLEQSDLVVLNDTRVFPARLYAQSSGKPVEVLLIRQESETVWKALVKPGKKARLGRRLSFIPGEFEAEVVGCDSTPVRSLRFHFQGDFWDWIEQIGRIPVPPYIRRSAQRGSSESDRERYQTVYARKRGSVAAPTAGLHFTEAILSRLSYCFLTLHVGYGTFKPVKSRRIEEHRMDPEYYSIGCETAEIVNRHVDGGGRIVAVGTTTTRTLEYLARSQGTIQPGSGWTDLFIYPPFDFKITGALVTNFHLPGSTLLMLVSAFAGRKLLEECYRQAIERRYRFYSYGDAMLVY